MKYQIFDLDEVVIPSSGDMIFKAIRQVVLRIKENHKDPKLSIITTKFNRRKINDIDGVGYRMIVGLYCGEKVYFIEMSRLISSLLYDSIILKITRKRGGVECDISSIPEEIKGFQNLILKEMSIIISFPI